MLGSYTPMPILTPNAGSSSLRFALFSDALKPLHEGHIDRVKDHSKAVKQALEAVKKTGNHNITKVAHRVVHGGDSFCKPTLLNAKVFKKLEGLTALAPQHNPVNLLAIHAAQKLLPKAKHYALFDTAFHSTLPEHAFLYGLPYSLYQKERIRRYGFHGTSHQYVAREAAKLLKKKSPKLVTCHLGNGVSITAIAKGKSLDTSMGFTPLEGPAMGTRSGTIDPAIIFHLAKKKPLAKVQHLLEKESGFLGLSGISSDIRDLWAKPKDPRTKRTFDVFSYQVAKLISSYFVPLQGLPDAVVFTGGIGENAFYLRKQIMNHLKAFKLKALVISTNESLEMARQIKN